MAGDDLVGKGRSSYDMRDGVFTLIIGAVFVPVQLLAVVLQWTDNWFLPFGVCTAGATAIAAPILLKGQWSSVCAACQEGLHPNRYLDISVEGHDAVAAALDASDAPALLDAVRAHPRREAQKPKQWHRLTFEYCPSCWRVAIITFEGRPGRVILGGDAVYALLERSEIDVSS